MMVSPVGFLPTRHSENLTYTSSAVYGVIIFIMTCLFLSSKQFSSFCTFKTNRDSVELLFTMALSALLSVHPLLVGLAFLVGATVFLVVRSRNAGLEHLPGPFLAKYTDAWRGFKAWRYLNTNTSYQQKLLDRYGDVIRIGPNAVLVHDPEAIQTIYGVKARLDKVRSMTHWVLPFVFGEMLHLEIGPELMRTYKRVQHTKPSRKLVQAKPWSPLSMTKRMVFIEGRLHMLILYHRLRVMNPTSTT